MARRLFLIVILASLVAALLPSVALSSSPHERGVHERGFWQSLPYCNRHRRCVDTSDQGLVNQWAARVERGWSIRNIVNHWVAKRYLTGGLPGLCATAAANAGNGPAYATVYSTIQTSVSDYGFVVAC